MLKSVYQKTPAMNLENITLKWKKPDKKRHAYDSIDMKCAEQANPERQKTDFWLPEAGRKAEWEWTLTGYGVSFPCDKNIMELDSNDGCTMLWIY